MTLRTPELEALLDQWAVRFGQITTRDDATAVNLDRTEDRVYWALAYTYDEVDTYGTTMARGALRNVSVDDFRILEYHQKDRDPVGKPVALEDTDEGLWVGFVFADTPRAQELRKLVDGGFLRGVSVGFIPKDGYTRKDGVLVFTEVELHELSLVNTPSSKGALIDLARDTNHPDPDALADLLGYEERDEDNQPETVTVTIDGETFELDEKHRELAQAIKTLAAQGASPEILRSLLPSSDSPQNEDDTEQDAEGTETRSENETAATVAADAAERLRALAVLRSIRSLRTR